MDQLLTSDINSADALIDLSNIVRDDRLGGFGEANLIRLERVENALKSLYGASSISLYAVTDDSLLSAKLLTDRRQYAVLKQWHERGLLHTAGKADPILLELADATGLPIITRDKYRGYRRQYPWLDGSDDAILEPRVNSRGEVRLVHVQLKPVPESEMSISEENDLLHQQGLRARPDLLTRMWACPEPRCPWHRPEQTPFLFVPRWQNDRLFCDLHGLDVEDRGPRLAVAQLKVMRHGSECHRFPVHEGTPVEVGRGQEGVSLVPWLPEELRTKVSRVHLRFALSATGLTVEDISRNGTWHIRKDGIRRKLHGDTQPFGIGDRLELVPGLELIRSGRRFPTELQVDRRVAGSKEPPPETTSM